MRVSKRKARLPIHQCLKSCRSPYEIETDDDFVRMPVAACFVGSKGSGKTYSAIEWIKEMEQRGYVNRVFLLSPTVESNSMYTNLTTLNMEEDVCDDADLFQQALDHVLEKINAAREERENEIRYAELYEKYADGGEACLDVVELQTLKFQDYRLPDIPEEIRPLLLCDDVQGTSAFTNKRRDRMQHIAIKHRHLGLNLVCLVQTLQGMPRVQRLNTNVYCLFKTSDLKQLDEIASLFGAYISKERFMRLFKYATRDPFSFFMVDLNPKTPEHRFRKGFNELLSVDDSSDEDSS